jgi:hypothetical protein
VKGNALLIKFHNNFLRETSFCFIFSNEAFFFVVKENACKTFNSGPGTGFISACRL